MINHNSKAYHQTKQVTAEWLREHFYLSKEERDIVAQADREHRNLTVTLGGYSPAGRYIVKLEII